MLLSVLLFFWVLADLWQMEHTRKKPMRDKPLSNAVLFTWIGLILLAAVIYIIKTTS